MSFVPDFLQRHPTKLSSASPGAGGSLTERSGERSFAWDALVARVLHPVDVEIIEALMWVGQPLSAKRLENLFDDEERRYLSKISYHVRKLAKAGIIEETGWRPVRGVRETFYFLTPDTVREA